MGLSAAVLSASVLWAHASQSNVFSTTEVLTKKSPFETPVIDLWYTLHRATSYNASNQYYSFSNIRYAQPPTGNLRFAAPVPPKKNRTEQTGERDRRCYQANPGWLLIAGSFIKPYLMNNTTEFYQTYPSPASFPVPSIPAANPSETEDCLFLDVKVPDFVFREPSGSSEKLPVLVWVYGGGYTGGYKTQYPPAGLLSQSHTGNGRGLVYVALNYRLGAFGWLAGGEGVQSNAGLLDQKLALEWVKSYISHFGGDPQQVTVMGESAGGGSIMYHLTSPSGASSSNTLFQKAILQSPFFFPDPGQDRNREVYQNFLKAAKVKDIDGAKATSSETLRRANYEVVQAALYGQFSFGPVVDHKYVNMMPATAFASGQYRKPADLMIGHSAAEGIGFTYPWAINNTAFSDYARTLFPAASDFSISSITDTIYPPPGRTNVPYSTNIDRAALFTGDVIINCNSYLTALAYGNQTYNYLFDIPPALHGDDLHYTFGPDSSTKDERTRSLMQSYFALFSNFGIPNRDGIPYFERYGVESHVLDFGPTGAAMEIDPAASDRCMELLKRVNT